MSNAASIQELASWTGFRRRKIQSLEILETQGSECYKMARLKILRVFSKFLQSHWRMQARWPVYDRNEMSLFLELMDNDPENLDL